MRYPLQTVVVIALMAMVCGCDDAEAMQSWGETHQEWLNGFLEMPHGAPTQDVFLAVFGALNPEAFSAMFRAWAERLSLPIFVPIGSARRPPWPTKSRRWSARARPSAPNSKEAPAPGMRRV